MPLIAKTGKLEESELKRKVNKKNAKKNFLKLRLPKLKHFKDKKPFEMALFEMELRSKFIKKFKNIKHAKKLKMWENLGKDWKLKSKKCGI